MKSLLLPNLLLLALLSNATGSFNLIEINQLHGTQAFQFSDSNRTVYGAGQLGSITGFNGNLYFIAQDAYNNEELWTTDGTDGGTHLVKDINPNGSSQMGNIVTLGAQMLFMAADNNNWDFDLYASDGTAAGTVKIAELNEGWNDALTEARAGVAGNKLFFCASGDFKVTDGTFAGTHSIFNIQGCSQLPANFIDYSGKVYFTMGNNLGRMEIWETDGTQQNTRRAVDLSADTVNNIWSISKLFTFDGQLYLLGSGLNSGLFSVNNQGTLNRVLFNGNTSYVYNVHVENDQLFFTAYNGNFSNTYLYHMHAGGGSPEVVPALSNIPVGNGRSLSYCNNAIYFAGTNPQQLHRLSVYGLSHTMVDMPAHSMINYNAGEAQFLVGAGGNVFFAAEETSTGKQVFMESDGTTGGTRPIMPAGSDVNLPFNTILSCGAINVFDFKMFGNKVVVPANFNEAGRELWLYEPQAMTSAIPAVEKQVEISLFPNPVSEQLNLRITDFQNEQTHVRITDIKGSVVLEREVKGQPPVLDVSALPAGNYCLTLGFANKSLTTKKFTITR